MPSAASSAGASRAATSSGVASRCSAEKRVEAWAVMHPAAGWMGCAAPLITSAMLPSTDVSQGRSLTAVVMTVQPAVIGTAASVVASAGAIGASRALA